MQNEPMLRKRIRILLLIFITGLVLSGITAFPLEKELAWAEKFLASAYPGSDIFQWIKVARQGVQETNGRYPFMAYGTDWLAFAHLVIATAFIGPWRDPLRNIWVVEFGIIACVSVFPLAFIAGEVREVPFFWRVFDCLFGAVGGSILVCCYRDIKKLETLNVK